MNNEPKEDDAVMAASRVPEAEKQCKQNEEHKPHSSGASAPTGVTTVFDEMRTEIVCTFLNSVCRRFITGFLTKAGLDPSVFG